MVHGNEPAGRTAVERVLGKLRNEDPPFVGDLFAVLGNTIALQHNTRFIDCDLNRLWTDDRTRQLDAGGSVHGDRVEDTLQRSLHACLSELIDPARSIVFLDLHTSSSDTKPYIFVLRGVENRRFAAKLPIPLIFGLDSVLDGTLFGYLNSRLAVSLVLEGGKHERSSTVDNHEAGIWCSLFAAGHLSPRDISDGQAYCDHLEAQMREVGHAFEIFHRHPVLAEDQFVMKPGYLNFQNIRKGELLADDRNGEICSPEDCQIILPLYQAGTDGFFLVRPIALEA